MYKGIKTINIRDSKNNSFEKKQKKEKLKNKQGWCINKLHAYVNHVQH